MGAGVQQQPSGTAQASMADQSQFAWTANFIWGIADDVLRYLYVRGKYRDMILPMTVLRRLDSILAPRRSRVLEMEKKVDGARIDNQYAALRTEARQAFYNTSKFTLRDLRARASQHQFRADVENYLDGSSPNVQDILGEFGFRNQIPRLSGPDALATLIEKCPSPEVNLGPEPVFNGDGSVKSPAWTTMQWARSSGNWSGDSTKTTTKRRASTGRPAMPWQEEQNKATNRNSFRGDRS